MKPFGPLMVEHRLIERMVALMKSRLDILEAGEAVQTRELDEFIRSAVDFFRTYADKNSKRI
jgi:hemerythrin-like domain-containing protein